MGTVRETLYKICLLARCSVKGHRLGADADAEKTTDLRSITLVR